MRCLLGLLVLLGSASHASLLFESDEVLDIILKGPFSRLIADNVERQEHSFTLIVDGVSHAVEIRVRGNSRVRVCSFPPLRLGFYSSDAPESVFSGQDKLKLVTHCKNTADHEQNVLEEYAAYRIFNVLSNVSLRTRLARISYVDTEDPGGHELVRYAFLIEPTTALAERHAGALVSARRATKNYLDTTQATLGYVFQYLIGNTDWSLVRPMDSDICCHNVDLVDIDGRHFYVPYDFDLAGMVDARYAKPDPSLKIRRVTQRRYRGYCVARDALRDSLQAVVRQRRDILNVIRELPGSTAKNTDRRLGYLERFFELASDENRLLDRFESRCL